MYLVKKLSVFMESIKIAALQKPAIGSCDKPVHSSVCFRTSFCQVTFCMCIRRAFAIVTFAMSAVRRSCCLTEQPEGKLLLGFVLKFVHAFQFWWKSDTNIGPLSWWPTYMCYYFCYVVITVMVTTVTLATFVNQDHDCFCGCFCGYANSSEVFLCAGIL